MQLVTPRSEASHKKLTAAQLFKKYHTFHAFCSYTVFFAVKATGVILLLGVGSLVCYKICNHYWPRPRPRPRPWPHARTRKRETGVVDEAQDNEDQLLEDLEDVDLSEVEVRSELQIHILYSKTVMCNLCGVCIALLTLWLCSC